MAKAIDYAGDALNYGVPIALLSAVLAWRALAAVSIFAVMLAGRRP